MYNSLVPTVSISSDSGSIFSNSGSDFDSGSSDSDSVSSVSSDSDSVSSARSAPVLLTSLSIAGSCFLFCGFAQIENGILPKGGLL